MSLSGEEPRAPMSLSGEEPRAPMSDVVAPRISRSRAAVIVVVAMAAAGALIGALWAWMAPPIHGVVALTRSGARVHAYLGNEADNFFVAPVLITGMVVVLVVVCAVLVWQWRAHRGPMLVGALAVGAAAAAGAAAGVGAVLVLWRYGVIDIAGAPVTPDHRVHYVTEAPPVFFGHTPLQIVMAIMAPVAAAALAYALIAVSTARDDLGAWPPVGETVARPPAITADGALPSSRP